MTFQFLCPQQHLLQGDESQMGQQCQCPQCGIVFIIPTVQLQQPQQYVAPAHDPYAQQPYAPQQYAPQYGQPNPFTEPHADPYTAHLENYGAPHEQHIAPHEQYVAPHDEPYVAPHEEYAQQAAAQSAAGEDLGHLEGSAESADHSDMHDVDAEAVPRVVHIPCPNGHELETPLDMIGQEVLCPHCAAQFRLRNEDSVEFKAYQEKLDIKRNRMWFNLSIAAAVVVFFGLLIMILVSRLPK